MRLQIDLLGAGKNCKHNYGRFDIPGSKDPAFLRLDTIFWIYRILISKCQDRFLGGGPRDSLRTGLRGNFPT